jgi:hypothetical protein
LPENSHTHVYLLQLWNEEQFQHIKVHSQCKVSSAKKKDHTPCSELLHTKY